MRVQWLIHQRQWGQRLVLGVAPRTAVIAHSRGRAVLPQAPPLSLAAGLGDDDCMGTPGESKWTDRGTQCHLEQVRRSWVTARTCGVPRAAPREVTRTTVLRRGWKVVVPVLSHGSRCSLMQRPQGVNGARAVRKNGPPRPLGPVTGRDLSQAGAGTSPGRVRVAFKHTGYRGRRA